MFTGLVQTTGTLAERSARGPGFRLRISAPELPAPISGESIAVNGVCLTVSEPLERGFVADISAETVQLTTLGRLELGACLNLERSLRVGDGLGGHWVSGHVDGIARVVSVSSVGEAVRVVLEPPSELARYLARKGSVALDGVSLTINGSSAAAFEVMLVPHTLNVTNLKQLARGVELNIEVDLLARYAVHWLESSGEPANRPSQLEQALRESGFLS
jgi:riboflavin synthase